MIGFPRSEMSRKNSKHRALVQGRGNIAQALTVSPPLRKIDAFVSHATVDKQLVDAFSDLLHVGFGVHPARTFYSSNSDSGPDPGHDLAKAIRESLRTSTIAILIITPNFNLSSFCLAECGAVWVLQKKCLIFVCPPLSFTDIPLPLRHHRALGLTNLRDLDAARDMVRAAIPSTMSVSTGQWCAARDHFAERVENIRQRLDVSRQQGMSMISAGLPLTIPQVVNILSRRSTGKNLFAVVFDVDRLRQVNEAFGIPTGSLILEKVGTTLQQQRARDQEIIMSYRCGDDTFFALVHSSEEEALLIARKVLKLIAQIPKKIGRKDIHVTASAGIAQFRENEPSLHWLERAHFACEQARQDGGNTVAVHRMPLRRSWS
jgi:diguanylate cyclase (GGDEF)-like protein